MEVETIVKDKSSKTVYQALGAIAAIVTILVGINGLVNSEGNTHIENSNGNVITGDNNNLGTIINKVTSFFISSPEKKDENASSTSSEDTRISEINQDERRSGVSVPGENGKKFIYDNDFSLVGKVVKKYNDSYDYEKDLKGGISRIDIPDDGDKYYRVNVTTYDPESEVSICYCYTYNYEYKKDKFSDFTSASGELGGQRDDGLDGKGKAYFSGFGHADKMTDINTTIYVPPNWDSDLYFSSDIVEPRLTDTNLLLQLDIPFDGFWSKQKVGDTLTSHGHVRIEEIDKEEAGHDCFTI